MTFEEFFKKKKINLTTLQQANGGLFAEFKEHFELMGEKSFDHTKKYWFNKLRRQFPALAEVKAEKVIIENPLAEQTVAESLTEHATEDKPKVGFTPRFKAGTTAAKPAETISQPPVSEETKAPDTEKAETMAKPGFTPRFKAGFTAKPTEPETQEQKPASEEPAKPATTSKPGFTPRFKAGVTKAASEAASEQPKSEEEKTEKSTTPPQPAKVGFTPRFKAGVTATKPAEPASEPQQEAEKPADATETPAKPKVGFTSRFKAGVNSTKPEEPIEETKPEEELPKSDPGAEQPDQPANPTPKMGFKPRFKPPQQ